LGELTPILGEIRFGSDYSSKNVAASIKIPYFFAEFGLGPEVWDQFDSGQGIFRDHDADDIISKGKSGYPEDAAVNLRRPYDLTLLAERDRVGWFEQIVRCSGLYLDETKNVVLQGDQIDLPGHLHAAAVPSDRNFEIRDDDAVTVLLEKPGGDLFTTLAKVKMWHLP
jgi:hypothetical protein